MIRKMSSLRDPVFLSQIACTVGRSEHCTIDEEDIKQGSNDPIYLAGGYWRALPEWAEDGTYLRGVRLVNPDRSTAECRAVERGIAILLHEAFEE